MITVTLKEGEKRMIRSRLERKTGSGAIVLTTPQRRILNVSNGVVTGFDWATAVWDADKYEISALHDSTLTGLTAPGIYYFWMQGVIGLEIYKSVHKIVIEEAGP